VTPMKELVFGPPPDEKKAPVTLTWMAKVDDVDAQPIYKMTTTESPRRNSSFKVKVFSYDVRKCMLIHGDVTQVGSDLKKEAQPITFDGTTFSTGLTATPIAPGTYTGPANALLNENSLSYADKQSLKKAPTYEFRISGLTQTQADQKAKAIAKELARRARSAHIVIDGDPLFNPQARVQLREGIPGCLDEWNNINMEVASVTHAYGMSGDGFTTTLGCLAIPPGVIDSAAQLINQLPTGSATPRTKPLPTPTGSGG